jgi:UDPglucose 6-dehydrogenase
MTDQRSLAVVGAGYVGLATAATFLELGHQVALLDVDEPRILGLRDGVSPIDEPGLDAALARARERGTVVFTTEPKEALSTADVVFVCVGTPRLDSGEADLSYLEAALATAGKFGSRAPIVIKSTVPPGTSSRLHKQFPELTLVSNPEFLRQGSAVADALQPDRIVIGATSAVEGNLVRSLYAPMERLGVEVVATDTESAELIKYAANTMLAIRIAFINEVADVCEASGADIDDVARGVGLDPRIGNSFLQAGPGFGGSCFPKDTRALVEASRQLGAPVTVVEAAETSNRRRRASLAGRVAALLGASESQKVGVLGLSFKSGTDDLRESPAVDLVRGLLELGVEVAAFDPLLPAQLGPLAPEAVLAASALEAIRGADALVVVTEWPEFSRLDFGDVADAMRGTTVVDLRNILDPEKVSAAGLSLFQVGKSNWRLGRVQL